MQRLNLPAKRSALLRLILLVTPVVLNSQTADKPAFGQWAKWKADAKIVPVLSFQLWSTYTSGQEVYNKQTKQYEAVDNRLNFQFRRARFGFRAQPYERLKFNLVGFYDLLGRDLLSATLGGQNNSRNVGIFDAFMDWKVTPGSELLYLTGGLFRPQFSRESITSAWNVSSFEKSMSQTYIREHLTGVGTGRSMGVNLGGLWLPSGKKWGLQYNLGLFDPAFKAFGNASAGSPASPLLAGRVVLYLGDPEQEQYRIGYQINYFNERKGLSLAGSGAWQGNSPLADQSYAAEADFLLNWGALNLDGEVNWMIREQADQSYTSRTGHLRAGCNFTAGTHYFLEPVVMMMFFRGALDADNQTLAAALGESSGEETTLDAGINWYLNRNNLKLALHYTWNKGDAGAAGEGSTVNAYFNQSGVGAIRRGNWLGLGLNASF